MDYPSSSQLKTSGLRPRVSASEAGSPCGEPFTEDMLVKAHRRIRDIQAQWKILPVSERIRPLRRMREKLVRESDSFVQVISRENGKTDLESLSQELLPVLDTILFLEKKSEGILEPKRFSLTTRQFYFRGKDNQVQYHPYGTIGILGTWNYPFVLSLGQILFALVAGNGVVFKGAEESERVTDMIRDLVVSAGFPSDLVFFYTAGREGGEALCRLGCDKYILTGSRPTGRSVLKALADKLKPAVMELSGSDPYVVLTDADWQLACQTLLWASFQYSGQTCVAPRRVCVLKKDRALFMDSFGKEWERSSAYLDEKGMLRTPSRARQEKEKLNQLTKRGAKLIFGKPFEDMDSAYFPPQVYADLDPDKVGDLDFMAPVFFLLEFDSEDEIIEFVNKGWSGLGASLWTRNRTTAHAYAEKIDAGQLWINDSIFSVALGEVPFGGIKESGFGKTRGPEGLLEMVRPKFVSFDWRKRRTRVHLPPYLSPSYAILNQIQKVLYETSFKLKIRAFLNAVRIMIKGRS